MNLDQTIKKLKTNKKKFAEAIGVHPTTTYGWKNQIPEGYQTKVNKLLENPELLEKKTRKKASKKKAAKKVRRKAKKNPITFEEVGVLQPSSKAVIMILDTAEAEQFLNRLLVSSEVG